MAGMRVHVKIFDVTRSLFSDTLVYPGDAVPSFIQRNSGNYQIRDFQLGSHSGTHVDAPSHCVENGLSIDLVPLDNLMGRCRVIDMSGAGEIITGDDLSGKCEGANRLFLRTLFSGTDHFCENYPCLDITAARILSGGGIKCVGIDSPSIESYHGDGSVHREILGNGGSIIELLDLSGVEAGEYIMMALPLRLSGFDGAPARVILLRDEERELWTC
jgi:arylformamidase